MTEEERLKSYKKKLSRDEVGKIENLLRYRAKKGVGGVEEWSSTDFSGENPRNDENFRYTGPYKPGNPNSKQRPLNFLWI